MSQQLGLSLLGGIQIKYNGQTIKGFNSRKTQALLCYLVVSKRSHSRAALAGLFWGSLPETSARRNLRKALSNLRKLVASHLDITRQTVAFKQDSSYWLDVEALEEDLLGNMTEPDLKKLKRGIALYRGAFMEGSFIGDAPTFEEWILLERERLRSLVLRAYQVLVAHYIQQGATESEWAEGLKYTQRLLALDSWREVSHRQMMTLLALNGQRSAALAQYETCRQILAEALGVAPGLETTTLYEQIRDGLFPDERPDTQEKNQTVTDWQDAPRINHFYGRIAELETLRNWLLNERSPLLAVLGIGGQGKTTLAAQTARLLAEVMERDQGFQRIVWRSLINAPPLETLLLSITQFLSGQPTAELPPTLDEQLSHLLRLLRRERCLLIIDNLESILRPGRQVGLYRAGYQPYQQLFYLLAEREHQSALLITSRELPEGFQQLEKNNPRVHSFSLSGLSQRAGKQILASHNLSQDSPEVATLVSRYSGNPLALNLVADTIDLLFEGDIDSFLSGETPIFDDIRTVLDDQFARLSSLERELLYWLAIEREATSLKTLRANLRHPPAQRHLLEALRALQKRALIERRPGGIALQNVIMEYLTDRFIETALHELESGQFALLHQHALVKATAKEYVYQNQCRLILEPIAASLLAQYGKPRLTEKLKSLLAHLRSSAIAQPGYAGGNLLNLILYLNIDPQSYNFAGLSIWQAQLQGKMLPGLNFSQADFRETLFSDTFGVICSIAYSPDGKLLAAGTMKGEVRLWTTTELSPYGIFSGHSGPVWSVAISPDNRHLASGSNDKTARLWNIETGQPSHIFSAHKETVSKVAFSPVANLLATAGGDGTVRLWNPETGQLMGLLKHSAWLSALGFSPNGKQLASGGYDQLVSVWDVESGQKLNTLKGHSARLRLTVFSPNGKTLVSAGDEPDIYLWDVESGQIKHKLRGHTSRIRAVDFSPNGQILASASQDQTVRLWNVQTGRIDRVLRRHTDWVRGVAFNPTGNGKTLVSGGDDQAIYFWDVDSGQVHYSLRGYSSRVKGVAFSPNGALLASASDDQTLRLWQVETGQLSRTLSGHSDWVSAVVFSSSGKTLASASDDQTLRLWDVDSGQTTHILRGHTKRATAVAFSPNGNTLVSAGIDQTVRLWDVKTGALRRTLQGHSDLVYSVAFSPNGQSVASAGFDYAIRLWNIHSGEIERIIQLPPHVMLCVAFSPKGEILAAGCGDNVIRLWEVKTGILCQELSGHTDWIWSLDFSANGKMLASSSADKTVRLWNISQEQADTIFKGHTDRVWSVAYSPNGRYLASGSSDKTIKLWNVKTGQCYRTLAIPGPYHKMNISGAKGLSPAQKSALITLGAV